MSKIVEKLVDMNSDPNARDQDGMTPLHIASYFGHVDVVEMLIKRRTPSFIKSCTFSRSCVSITRTKANCIAFCFIFAVKDKQVKNTYSYE
jgi:ankyrin repeat protein